MALHYFLSPLKILVLLNVLIEVDTRLVYKQRLILKRKPLSFFTVLLSLCTSFFNFLIACKLTSTYTFINRYPTLASVQGGGGGGGGHGNDYWMIPYSCHSI